MKRFVIAVLAMLITVGAYAQQEYAYGHALELKAGYAGHLYTLEGPGGRLNSVAGGSNWSIRYTFYPGDHWGFYLAGSIMDTGVDGKSYVDKLAAVDDGTHRFYPGYYDCEPFGYFAVTAGGAYRLDFGQWSLRPRLGIGYAECVFGHNTRYAQKNIASMVERPQFVEVYHVGSPKGLLCQTSLQLTYTFSQHFFFSLEGEVNALPGKSSWKRVVYEGRRSDELSSMPDSYVANPVYFGELDKKVEEKEFQRSTGLCWNISFGIGWNIGWNRNEAGRR